MRTSILTYLLLCHLFAWGQKTILTTMPPRMEVETDSGTIRYIQMNGSWGNAESPFIPIETKRHTHFDYHFPDPPEVNITIQALGEYWKECYSDSTCQDVKSHANNSFQWHQQVSTDKGVYWLCDCPFVKEYSHRTPTFEGFKEWLNKRKKQ